MNPGHCNNISLRKWLVGGIIATCCLLVLYAHIRIAQIGIDYTGLLAPLDRIFDLSAAMFLIATAFCLGRAMARKLLLAFDNIAEEISISVMLGTGALGLGILGLGLAGGLSLLPVALLLALFLGFSRHEMRRMLELSEQGFRLAMAASEQRAAALLFGALAIILLFLAMSPPYVSDELIYHLAVPKRFVEQGGVYPVYDNAFGNMPLLIHMIYAFCLLIKADIAAKMFSLFLTLTTALALYGFCARFLTRHIGMLSMLAFFGAGMVIEVAVTALIDATLAGMLFVATYAMMVYLDSKQTGWLYTSALLSGFALGIKLTAGPWLALLGFMYLAESILRKPGTISGIVKNGCIYVAMVAMVASPWFIKNEIWFHNPIYPFLSGEVASYGVDGVRYFNSEDESKLDAHFAAARKEIPATVTALEQRLHAAANDHPDRHPLRFWQYFLGPLANSGDGINYFPNYLFLLLPLSVLFIRQRQAVWLAVISVGFYVIIAETSWIGRYFLPVYPALTVVSILGLVNMAAWLRAFSPAVADRLAGYAVTVILSATFLIFISIELFVPLPYLKFIAGSVSRHEFLNSFKNYRPIDFINKKLAKNSRILLLGEERNYYLQRDCIVNPGWNSTDWRRLLLRNRSLDGVYQDMKRQEITHVLFYPEVFLGVAALGRAGSGGADKMYPSKLNGAHADSYVQLRNWATFELFKDKFLASIYADNNGFTIYQLK